MRPLRCSVLPGAEIFSARSVFHFRNKKQIVSCCVNNCGMLLAFSEQLSMRATTNRLESCANWAIIVLLLVVLVTAAEHRIQRRPVPNATNATRIGSKLKLDGIDWSTSRSTFVLVISTTCRFCNESEGFYRSLSETAVVSKARLIAVLPQPTTETSKYLRAHSIQTEKVLQSPLGSIGVSGTPTILEVDSDGVIRNSWFGKLGKEKELEVKLEMSREGRK